jgi:DNA-binding beta-propeller fold protein YncE
MTKHLLATALLLTVFAACGDNAKPPEEVIDARSRAVIVSGSFVPGEPGVMAVLDLDTLDVRNRVAPNGAVAEDPMIRRIGDELFVVNRASGNNVTIIDARTFRVVDQLATGAGSNPQDVAVVGNKLYVPAFQTAGVVVVNRASGETTTIDLASLDPDGQPNCITAYAVDTDVYVACELLDENFSARGPGKVVVIDTATDTVRTTLTLANNNPFGVFERMLEEAGGDLVIPTVPDFVDFATGCVERITPGPTPAVGPCVVTNQELGGYVSRIDFSLLADSLPVQWMVVSKFDTEARGNLQGFDLEANTLWPEPISPPTMVLVDIAICPGDKFVVADQTMAANGLRVFEGATEVTTEPLAIGLKPGSAHGLTCY